MKKVLGQTVRDLKRGVNKKVLKVPGIEQKILDATNNEPWGPHGSHLADLAQATRNYQDYKMIMNVIWKRINDTGKNWRHVYKALTVLEYLVAHGSDRVIDEIREHAHQISTLSNFQYVDSGGRDQGGNIRRKSQSLVSLVNDKERLHEVRQKAIANKDKFQSTISTSNGARRSFGDCYGSRDDEQNGNGREGGYGYRDDDRYGRGRHSYSQDGDRYSRDNEERFGKDNDDYQLESRGSVDRYTEHSVDDEDRYSTRRPERHLQEENVGAPPSYEEATKDVQSHNQNERDEKAVASPEDGSSSQNAPKATSPARTASSDHAVSADSLATPNEEINAFDEFDPRGSVPANLSSASNPDFDFFGSLSASNSTNSLALMLTSEADIPSNSGFGTDFAAPVATSTSWSQGDGNPFGDEPFMAIPQENVQIQPQNSAAVSSGEPFQPVAPNMETSPTFDFGDMFGGLSYPQQVSNDQHSSATSAFSAPDTPFTLDVLDGILPRTDSTNSISSQAAQPAAHTYLQTAMFPPQSDTFSSHADHSAARNNIQDTSLNFPQQGVHGSTSSPSQGVPISPWAAQQLPSQGAPASSQAATFATGNNMQLAQSEHLNTFQQPSFSSQAAQPAAAGNIQSTQLNLLQQQGASTPQAAPTTAFGPPPKVQSTKFQPKSTVWADTLNRGLVDFNISGAKVNPLSDIGIDFDSINRMEKRKEVKSSATPVTSTVTMGKAMGSGSGIGRAGATGIAPPPNPMMSSNMGMGGGGGMGMAPGMGMAGNSGMRMGVNQPHIGMSMATGPGAMWSPNGTPLPGPGMPSVGYNPTMGMGNYGSQHAYGGAPPQQQFGGGYR